MTDSIKCFYLNDAAHRVTENADVHASNLR